jgi:vacuolar-type H+-ATPase subunit I/STV1
MMDLMTLCGITSALIGLLTGSFFGDAIPTIAGIYGHKVNLPYVFSPLEDPLLVLIGALAIGFFQIIVGMAISAYMKIRDGHPLDALMDEGSWWLLFAASPFSHLAAHTGWRYRGRGSGAYPGQKQTDHHWQAYRRTCKPLQHNKLFR